MLIFLPNEMADLRLVDDKINTVNMNHVSWSLENDDDVEVQLPRFKMEEKMDLKETLKKASLVHTYHIRMIRITSILNIISNIYGIMVSWPNAYSFQKGYFLMHTEVFRMNTFTI